MRNRILCLLCVLLSIQLSAQTEEAPDSLKAKSLLLKGQALWEAGDLEAAQPLLQKAFKLFGKAAAHIQELETLQILLPLLILSNQDNRLKDYLKDLRTESKEYPAERAAVFGQMAKIYHLRHNPKAAEFAVQQAVELYQKAQKSEKAAELLYWKSQYSKEKLERLMYLDQAEKLLYSSNSTEAKNLSIQIRTAKAASCLDYNDLQEADSLLTQNLDGNNSSKQLALNYLQMARLQWHKESYTQAETTFAKAYLLLRNQQAPKQLAELYYYWGSMKAELGKTKTASTYFERALNYLQLGPKLTIGRAFHSPLHIIDQKLALSILLGYSQFTSKKKALAAVENAVELIQHFSRNTGLPYYHSYYDDIYRRGLKLLTDNKASSPLSQNAKKAFLWMEQRRMQKIAASIFTDYPSIKNDSLLKKGQTIHLRYQQQLQQLQHQNSSLYTEKLHIWDQLFDEYRLQLKETKKALYNLRYQSISPTQIDQIIQQQLSKDALVFYYLDDESAYAAVIHTDKSLGLYRLQNQADYVNKIINLQELLAQPLTQSLTLCANALKQFHQDWVAPLQLEKAERLKLITDGALLYIPFETAIENKHQEVEENFNDLNYLLLTKDIQYQYCLKDLIPKDRKTVENGNILVFAGQYQLTASAKELLNDFKLNLRQKLKELPQAPKELDMLFERFRGSFYEGINADEANLKLLAKDPIYSIIHLAIRSIPSDQHLHLAFNYNPKTEEDDFISATEILNIDISADLVVLSALNLGQAAWTEKHHEQYLGLEYSFIMKGTPALVKTLWETDLNSSVKIMELFYELVSRGYNKSQALTEAKRVYLSESRSDLAHPYYWANIIQFGDAQAIELSKRSFIERYWFYGMLIVFSILGLAVFIWRINQMSLGRQ